MRALSALREWLQLRGRVRKERWFHIEQAVVEFHNEGMSWRAANRKARIRFGNRGHWKFALRELGGDLPGLAYLLRAHRVAASAWLQPALLIALIALILSSSPAPRVLVEGLIGTPLASDDRDAVFVAGGGRNPWDTSITPKDFEALRALATLSHVERYQPYTPARGLSEGPR
jgi:hypothetical protein